MALTFIDPRAAYRLATKALLSGGIRRSMAHIEWDASGSCLRPIWREMQSRPYADRKFGPQATLLFSLWVPCRRCDRCRARKRRHWELRALAETAASARTWFGTLTLRPEEHYQALVQRSRFLRGRGVDFGRLPEWERFAERERVSSRYITLMLKRLRKASKAPLRYLLVCEAHKSGLPHYHMLLHEPDPYRPVRHAELQRAWPYGFTKWNLVTDAATAAYPCKYLGKSTLARVRASVRYGTTISDLRE